MSLSQEPIKKLATNLSNNINSVKPKQKKTPSKSSSATTNSCSDEKVFEIDLPVQEKYTIVKRLGKGAYGIVWEAVELRSGTKVALKKIFDAFRNNTDAQRTYREIIFLLEFGSHPNIINLTNAHRAQNDLDFYLSFPLMMTDLHKLVKSAPERLGKEAIHSIMYQISKAVLYIHSANVIHRDLKPANILLDHKLGAKLADFGLARSVTGVEIGAGKGCPEMTDYVATRWYRPPEILLNVRNYTKAVDIWSLACILGEMMKKEALFPAANTMEQIELVLGSIQKPSRMEIEEITNDITRHLVLSAVKFRNSPISETLKDNDPEAIDMIERILIFDPQKRLTIEQVISHPFLQWQRSVSTEIVMNYSVAPPINDNVNLPLASYRNVLYEILHAGQLTAKEPLAETLRIFKESHQKPEVKKKRKTFSIYTIPKKSEFEMNEIEDGAVGDLHELRQSTGSQTDSSSSVRTLKHDIGAIKAVKGHNVDLLATAQRIRIGVGHSKTSREESATARKEFKSPREESETTKRKGVKGLKRKKILNFMNQNTVNSSYSAKTFTNTNKSNSSTKVHDILRKSGKSDESLKLSLGLHKQGKTEVVKQRLDTAPPSISSIAATQIKLPYERLRWATTPSAPSDFSTFATEIITKSKKMKAKGLRPSRPTEFKSKLKEIDHKFDTMTLNLDYYHGKDVEKGVTRVRHAQQDRNYFGGSLPVSRPSTTLPRIREKVQFNYPEIMESDLPKTTVCQSDYLTFIDESRPGSRNNRSHNLPHFPIRHKCELFNIPAQSNQIQELPLDNVTIVNETPPDSRDRGRRRVSAAESNSSHYEEKYEFSNSPDQTLTQAQSRVCDRFSKQSSYPSPVEARSCPKTLATNSSFDSENSRRLSIQKARENYKHSIYFPGIDSENNGSTANEIYTQYATQRSRIAEKLRPNQQSEVSGGHGYAEKEFRTRKKAKSRPPREHITFQNHQSMRPALSTNTQMTRLSSIREDSKHSRPYEYCANGHATISAKELDDLKATFSQVGRY